MLKSKPKIRLFAESPLEPGVDLTLGEAQTHYLANVMRVHAGDTLLLFNGRDGEWASTVARIGKNRCSVSVDLQTREQRPEDGPWLAFAPVKKSAVDFIAEKATELGAARLCPHPYTPGRRGAGSTSTGCGQRHRGGRAIGTPDRSGGDGTGDVRAPRLLLAVRQTAFHIAWTGPRPTGFRAFHGHRTRARRTATAAARFFDRSGGGPQFVRT
ncbi:MAG: hypothetical protein HC814_01485 [Rhodobacteraceae bacterium]|nr:hypothetical protein [Paracoccaceae bacterium]